MNKIIDCKFNRLGTLAAIGCVVATLLQGSISHAGQEKLAVKTAATSTELIRTRDQLQITMEALTALVRQKQGDLKPAYANYCAEVAKTKAAADWTRETARDMATNSVVYFDAWARESDEISNQNLRKLSLKRMDKVQRNYQKANAALEAAAAKFAPFLSDLSDIQKVLSKDLTAGGVKSLRRTVSSAELNLGYLRRSVDAASTRLNELSESLEPESK